VQVDDRVNGPAQTSTGDHFVVGALEISLPKGGGAIRGIGEKFSANPVTGTGSVSVPIYASSGRAGLGPQLSIAYNSGASNGPFGFGWSVSLPEITRKTDKGLPRYDDAEDSDVFVLSGAEDLVPLLANTNGAWDKIENPRTIYGKHYLVRRYRPRIEGLFARIERFTNVADPTDVFWRSISRDNTTTWYGKTSESRIADLADPEHIFSWLACELYDDKGGVASFRYATENDDGIAVGAAHERNRTTRSRSANRYLTHVRYGNRTPYYPDLTAEEAVALPADWCFELVLDYGEHDKDVPLPDEPGKTWLVRDDPFSTYRSGFDVRTYRLCRRALMFHHFPNDENVGQSCLVRSTGFTYAQDLAPNDPHNPTYAKLVAVTQTGYRRSAGGYVAKSLPPLAFEYAEPEISDTIHEVDRQSLENLPEGLDGSRYQWVDLDGEGVSSVLTEQGECWYYKRNLSPVNPGSESGAPPPSARFAPAEAIRRRPSLAALGGGSQHLLDLDGSGQLDLVAFGGSDPGFFERTASETWEAFRPFAELPALDWHNPDLKFVDLTGDGRADILISEDEAFCWHQSRAHAGFAPAHRVRFPLDEEKGPRIVFADGTESIFLADLSGDGLTDIARIRNGEVCYWPNLGYGRFGAKITMENAPWFDAPDLFDGRRIRLADIDGSGTTDIVYLSRSGAQIYFNQSGNGWSARRVLTAFPIVDDVCAATVLDLLGIGTACLVWSSPVPGEASRRMRYVDLMGGVKPHLLVKVVNNLGAEIRIQYAPSTQFYLADKMAGKPWITRLPFPVHVVTRIETYDYVSRNRFVVRHAYHHGYFDGAEREFRGFGMVEQWDTEEFAALTDSGDFPDAANIDAASHVPPVLTRTWFHTGIYLGRNRVSNFFAGLLDANDKGEYYREPGLTDAQAKELLLDDTILPDGLSVDDAREACRALKGSMLRQEVYALDGTDKEPHPYAVVEQNFTVACLQPRAGNPYGVFFANPRESINYHYERIPSDPRISHSLTLEVDQFGDVLRALAVCYGRRQADATLTGPDQAKQSAVLITYAENAFTLAIDGPDAWRAPLVSYQRAYEITGFRPSQRFTFDEWLENNFSRLDGATEIPYEQAADGTQPQKRLIKFACTRYRKNDLSDLLPQGVAESQAMPGQAYRLAFTPGMLTQIYHRSIGGGPDENLLPDPASVLGGAGGDQGGYVDLFRDGSWWVPSGRQFFDVNADSANPAATAAAELAQARAHFYLPQKFVDPFGQSSTAGHDADDLLVVSSTDALGNTIGAENDYCVLAPWRLTDPNGNRTAMAFDALGFATAIAVAGKASETVGDLLTGFAAYLAQADLDALFDAPDPRMAAPGLLGQATTRFVYDIDRFQRTQTAYPNDPTQWLPPQGATLARETHVSDLAPGATSDILVSFAYSDGFGRIVQTKMPAEAGPVTAGGPVASSRWVGSGWTINDNKGHPVRQYEPFFSASHGFEFANTVGVSPVTFYDPLGRVVATLHPNHTWQKVVFDPWRQETWDVNDTALVADPKADPDVGSFFQRLADTEYLPTWYAQRQGGARGMDEQDAAAKTAVHSATPSLAHADSLGRTFLTLAHNKFVRNGATVEEKYATRAELDIEGNQREVTDGNDRIVMRYDYNVLGTRVHQASIEAGERWMLNDMAGKPIYAWDSRNHRFRTAHDPLRRPTDAFLSEGGESELLVARTVYGETRPDPEAHNLRGKAVQLFDQAGVVTSDSYDFKGNLLGSSRQLAQDYKVTLDWSANPQLEPETFASSTDFDALNRPISMTAPDASVYRPSYNESNLLETVDVNLRGAPTATPFVANIDYDAKGQRVLIAYGNNVTTTYAYDPLTFRLVNLATTRATDQALLQDLSYNYDPTGNITKIADGAQQTVYFSNQAVTPDNDYVYDAVYRLINAEGREQIGQVARPQTTWDDQFRVNLPQPGNGQAMRRYSEAYQYDQVGNFLQLVHQATNGNWTRGYAYNEPSLVEPGKINNRLSSTTVGSSNPVTETYSYDAHGNMASMPHLTLIQWDFRDQLSATSRQAVNDGTPETTYYVYDSSGQRVRKVIERQNGTRKAQRIYLGGFEAYREYDGSGNAIVLERETLHVTDDKQRIALVETRTQSDDGSPEQLIRYQFGNHLNSASVELDDAAHIISYEEYYPYGSTSYQAARSGVEVSPKRYRYTGMERDEESGFEYHQARYYLPWLARWVSPDTLGLGDGVNGYLYVKDNPVLATDRNGMEGTIPLKSDLLRDKEFQKKLASYDDLIWSHTTNRHASRQAAQGQGGSSSKSVAPAQSAAPTPVPPAPVSNAVNPRVVHVRVDDLAHPLDYESILTTVTANYAKIGIAVDVQFGSFAEEDFHNRRDNIQITILSSAIDAADEQLVRGAFVNQGWAKPDREVATTVQVLRGASIAGFASGFDSDPLAKLIFVKEMDQATRTGLGQSFSLMYPNNPDAAKEALDVYFYADTFTHELGHDFGLPHSNDTNNYMYAPPPGQHYDLLTDIVARPDAVSRKSDPAAWGQWVKSELANSQRTFSQDQITKMRETLQKFLPSVATGGGRGSRH
jgi:RHS repeat-associated protein